MPTIIKSSIFGGTKFFEGKNADAELLKSGIFPARLERNIKREAFDEAVDFVISEIENATKTVCVVVRGERKYVPIKEAEKLGLI